LRQKCLDDDLSNFPCRKKKPEPQTKVPDGYLISRSYYRETSNFASFLYKNEELHTLVL